MKTKAWILALVLLLFEKTSYSQNFDAKERTLKKVFGNIVYAYGNAKAPPSLELITKKNSEGYPASYISTPRPVVKVEEQVFDICMQMGADSLNALSIIISHELAHYYNDHTWCNDYSYAIRNSELGKLLKRQTKGEQLIYETQADNNSFYYSCIAGYAPFGIYDKLIDRIYSVYKLPATVKGYPGKEERKMISREAQQKIRQLYPIYNAGLLLLYLNQLQAAESCFDYLAKYFPSREIYNNLGTAKFLAALAFKPYETVNFIYPVDIDPVSRIEQNSTRSADNDNAIYFGMLKDAKKHFEKAISLDPSYISSHINLACVNDALGNYQMALGNIYEAWQLSTNDPVKLKHIKAIVEYHSGNSDIAETELQTLAKQDSVAAFNFRLLKIAKSAKNNDMAVAKFRDNYAASLMNEISIARNCKTITGVIPNGKRAETKINGKLTVTSEITDNYSRVETDLFGKKIEATILIGQRIDQETNTRNFGFINPDNGCLVFTGSFTKTISYKVK
jgi:tetratricopeptide (TPR) repeat protein